MSSKSQNKVVGNYGENLAAEYLRDIGYRIVSRNYNTQVGEIDIIALDKDYLVFIEVKSRNSTKYGYPHEAVDYIKKGRIIDTALYYIAQNNIVNRQIRFDIVEVFLSSEKIKLYKNAFIME